MTGQRTDLILAKILRIDVDKPGEPEGVSPRRNYSVPKDNPVVALKGVACLYGLLMVSDLVKALAANVPGRLLVFFPGEHEGNNYRLLDARDGWNYLAVPITAHDIGATP